MWVVYDHVLVHYNYNVKNYIWKKLHYQKLLYYNEDIAI